MLLLSSKQTIVLSPRITIANQGIIKLFKSPKSQKIIPGNFALGLINRIRLTKAAQREARIMPLRINLKEKLLGNFRLLPSNKLKQVITMSRQMCQLEPIYRLSLKALPTSLKPSHLPTPRAHKGQLADCATRLVVRPQLKLKMRHILMR